MWQGKGTDAVSAKMMLNVYCPQVDVVHQRGLTSPDVGHILSEESSSGYDGWALNHPCYCRYNQLLFPFFLQYRSSRLEATVGQIFR